MEINLDKIFKALEFVIEPDLKKDIVALKLVDDVKYTADSVSLTVKISNPALHNKKRMKEAVVHNLKRFLGEELTYNVNIVALPSSNERRKELRTVLPNVDKIIAIASGKGGVGKSTITANLALGLKAKGYKVGIIDADIYGPSIPIMFNVEEEKPQISAKETTKNLMLPVEGYGVKILSIGFFAGAGQAVAWRGPMATKALNQMINDVDWGELDYLLIDLPPGTGDIHLSLVQALPLTGAVIVSTPQKVALTDARKGVGMFQLDGINVPVLGLVENMSYFSPPELPANKYYIFGKEGAKQLAEELKVPLLAQIPIVESIREAGDVGRPAILQETTPQAIAFTNMAESLVNELK